MSTDQDGNHVLRFGGKIFVFVSYLKQILLGTTKFEGHKILGALHWDAPHSYEPSTDTLVQNFLLFF